MSQKKVIWLAALLLIVLRLYITGDRDIFALNSPHDELWYVEAAFNHIWGGTYSEMRLIHLPIYAMWLKVLDLIGVPARLGIDLAWLAACGYLAYAFRRLVQVTWVAVGLFIFLAFHPYVIRIFDRALAETLLTVLSTLVLAAGIDLWNRRTEIPSAVRKCALFLYCFGFSAAYFTRSEGIVLLAPLGMLALWAVIDRRNWWFTALGRGMLIQLIALPLLSIGALSLGLCAANYTKWGVWASQELDAPGYKSAMAALSSIDTGSTPKQITVTQQMLALGFQASSTLRELQPLMSGPTGQQWVEIASPFVAVKGEIANGWFYWALRDVAAHAGWHVSAEFAERKYKAVDAELQHAFADGRLKKRFVFSSFIDPDIEKWSSDFPDSLRRISLLVISPTSEKLEIPRENANSSQLSKYVAITGRRTPAEFVVVGGWVTAPAGSSVGLDSEDGQIIWQGLGAARADVQNAYSFTASMHGLKAPRNMHIQTPEGKVRSVPISALQMGQVINLDSNGLSTDLRVGVDRLEVAEKRERAVKFISFISRLYVWLHYCLCVAFLIYGAVLLIQQTKSAESMLFIMLTIGIFSRVILFAILDASSWSGSQARYLLPIYPIYGAAGLLGINQIFRSLSDLRNKLKK